MIAETIFLIIFVCSLGGVLLILARKLPVLNSLSQNGSANAEKHPIVLATENKIKAVSVFFEKQIFLHKFLSWVKVLTLKVETYIDKHLHNIRKKAQEKK